MQDYQTLLLHNVLYAPEIQWNLTFVHILLYLGYKHGFESQVVNIYDDTSYSGCGYLSYGLFVLNISCSVFNIYNSYFSIIALSNNNVVDANI